jgi:hypothetical protein
MSSSDERPSLLDLELHQHGAWVYGHTLESHMRQPGGFVEEEDIAEGEQLQCDAESLAKYQREMDQILRRSWIDADHFE